MKLIIKTQSGSLYQVHQVTNEVYKLDKGRPIRKHVGKCVPEWLKVGNVMRTFDENGNQRRVTSPIVEITPATERRVTVASSSTSRPVAGSITERSSR